MADKNPNKIIDDLNVEDKWEKTYGGKIKTPLDEFKNYEDYITVGPDFFDSGKHYGAPIDGFGAKYNVPYPRLIEAYSKSKGKFADKALTDPEIKKYHDSRMAERAALYDRVRKVPQDKRADFFRGYGYFQDPFDYEDDGFTYGDDDKSVEDFLESFDYDYGGWETLKDYLDEGGY